MAIRPICEPVELPLGTSVLAERVTIAAGAPAIGRFMHFHDVAELVLFRRVRGEFVADGRRHALSDGAITFVPSMHHHDFALTGASMEWVLVQLDPYLTESLAHRPAFARLKRPFHAVPDAAVRARLDVLADWLVSAAHAGSDETVEPIVELLLLAAAESPEPDSAVEDQTPIHFERILPVLERLRRSPAEPISLCGAASMCSLSPAYFSRRFTRAMGMNFTEYVRTYRLHLAARRLATGRASISEIAFGVGFSSPSHFTARFRERFDMTPRDYRNGARRRAD
jgi:AraC-like DNA-binding protein